MNVSIVMPKIGLTMVEGKIVEWRKAVGDRIEKDDVVFVFETEKVTFEVEAQQSGVLSQILAQEEQVVQVGEEVGILSTETETAAAPADAVEPPSPAAAPAPKPADPDPHNPAPASPVPAAPSGGKVRATPLARRMAKDHGLDLAAIAARSSGPRVRKKDVEAALAAREAESPPAPAAAGPWTGDSGGARLVKRSGMRAIIAEKMLASTQQAAQAYMTASVDATRIVAARGAMVPGIEREAGVRPTITDLMVKIAAAAIGKHPVINTRWTADGILWFDRLHMGVAVALDDGLIVPVIPDVSAKSVADIARARADLVARGRAGGLAPEEMRGGTFTVTSLGMFGVEEFNGIINQPESAILAVGAIIDTPVAVDGAVAVRPIMKVTLTYDHRIIDGAKAGAFLMTLKSMLEEPVLALS